eukprot:scaffold96866_cov62-Phaeocystis_antarctica.AAC.2
MLFAPARGNGEREWCPLATCAARSPLAHAPPARTPTTTGSTCRSPAPSSPSRSFVGRRLKEPSSSRPCGPLTVRMQPALSRARVSF